MPIGRWMDKEDVVHIYNGILLSHKKEQNWVICRDVDGSRVCHTEWSKSEGEKQISNINTDMWNLEKWYRWTGLQGRNWDTDVENKRMDTKGGKLRGGGGGGVMNWAIGIDMYTLMCMRLMTNENLLYKKINKIQKKPLNLMITYIISFLIPSPSPQILRYLRIMVGGYVCVFCYAITLFPATN